LWDTWKKKMPGEAFSMYERELCGRGFSGDSVSDDNLTPYPLSMKWRGG
jgi:hypothetical protein